jgi:hypothetical protein
MTIHRINNRTLYFDDAAPKGCWPFHGCFGPWFPRIVKVEGQKLVRIDGLKYPEIRAVYQSRDASVVIFVKRDCKYLIEHNGPSKSATTQRRTSRR